MNIFGNILGNIYGNIFGNIFGNISGKSWKVPGTFLEIFVFRVR